jgi:hypothetical protein
MMGRMTYFDKNTGKYMPTEEFQRRMNGLDWGTINTIGKMEDEYERKENKNDVRKD